MSKSRRIELKFREENSSFAKNQYFRRDWAGVSVERMHLIGPHQYELSVQNPSHYIALHNIEGLDGEVTFDTLGTSTRRDLRDTLSFLPAGASAKGWMKIDGDNSFTAVHLNATPTDEETVSLQNLPPSRYFVSPVVKATILKIAEAASSPRPNSIYLETLAKTLELELQATLSGGRAQGSHPTMLSKGQLDRALDFIESNLSRDISLEDLAAVVGLSRFHFLKAFKGSIGETPYKFVVRRRLALARRLLTESEMPIHAIAIAAGFSSAEHFSRTFHACIGTSAREFRKRSS